MRCSNYSTFVFQCRIVHLLFRPIDYMIFLSLHPGILLYLGAILVACIFFFAPEVKDRTLEEVDEMFVA
jgi:hypothetical protein